MEHDDAAAPGGAGAIRFAADCMLGRLARWLRILGYDTLYEKAIEDEDLILRCARQGRVLLTRDSRLAGRRLARALGTRVVMVASDDPEEQLAQLVRDLTLTARPDRVLTRCLECNEPLRRVERTAAEGRIPPYVLATQQRFAECPACRRLYWRATHVDRMLGRLRAVLPDETSR